MCCKRWLLFALLIFAVAGSDVRSSADPQPLITITVSGTVTGPSGPVPNVWVGVGSPQDWQETWTNASGFYTVSIQTEGTLDCRIRPDLSTRLAQTNLWMDGVTANVIQDFGLTYGYLLSLRLPVSGIGDISEVQPLQHRLQDRSWYSLEWDESSRRQRAVLPPDVYYVTVHNPPAGYYQTTQAFDLRAADQITDMSLDTVYVHPIPYDPPDASKLTIGPPDDLGETTIAGDPGAVLPLARVLVVNLNSYHQAHTISEADGSFSTRIYAPPGSAIMVKHGPASSRWSELELGVSEMINPFPGTIVSVPHTHAGDSYELPFAAAGAIDWLVDDLSSTRNYVGSAWAMTGTIAPVIVEGQWTRVFTGTYDGQAVPGLYLGGLNWTHPALGDLDADGDPELLIGERSGRLVLYRNQGSVTTPDWQFESADYAGVDTGWWAYPALADVTKDGALDLFVGEGEGTVSIYYNRGTSAAPVWPDLPDASLTAGQQAVPALDDLDGDGDLDLVVGHQGGTLYHFENTGAGAYPTWTRQTDSYGGISEVSEWLQPAFVDLDGDADRDLLIGLCGQLVWYRRSGTPANPTWARVASDPIGYGGGSCASSPTVGDWDGDGDADLVTGEHWGVPRFFRNDGAPSWTEQSFAFPFDLAGDSAPALADWDNDGDLDMLLGQAHGNIYQYTNVGSAADPDWRPDGILLTLPPTDHPHAFPALADLDGDNDYDLFIGEGGWQSETGSGGNIHYYRNDGTPSSPNWTFVTSTFLGIDVGGWSTPSFADVDDDNDLDLLIGDEDGTLTLVENTGSATSPSWAAPVHPYAGLDVGTYSAPSFLDVDEDGDLDMLAGSGNGSLAYVRNTGSASTPAWDLVATAHPEINIGDHSTPTAADIDGDGRPDLLIGDGDGGLNVYLYEGPGSPPATGDTYAPGDLFQIEGTLRLYSPAITVTTQVDAISVHGGLALAMQHNQAGQPIAMQNYFMSTMLTPSGYPIQRAERSIEQMNTGCGVGNLHYLGGHVIEGVVSVSGQVPGDLPPGIYRPLLQLDFTGVPTSTSWLAANVVRHTFDAREAALPPITVGDVDPPRINWQLLMDDSVQGTRGTGAREDRGSLALTSQIVSQGAPYYVPPVDVRSGQPITYRLEPFLPMVSFTDRRMPAPPLMSFQLPGGHLRVTIEEPDGTMRDLGGEAFAQSFNRTKTTRGDNDLNAGTVQMEDVYSLMAASDRFRVTFDQYGHHVITMTGTINDVWGNSYGGGGTYDLWVAHPLDIDPGVMPVTPLAAGDALNPAIQFYPRVPAQVELTVTLYSGADPAQPIVRRLTGRANPYGYFGAGNPPIILNQPGEYRVDLTALYTDTSGEIYMGAMTWGGIVMSPGNEADLVAHGRRGLDSLEYIPNHWYVASRDLTFPEGAVSHSLNPYFSGDILWSRMSDDVDGGNALIMGASVQDTVGSIDAAIRARAERSYPGTSPPGDLGERFDKNEIPLFTSTRSGRPAQFALTKTQGTIPDDVDQIAYSYRSSQRPGVRVREVIAEDSESGGYWRLDTLYDDQLGVGVLGDQPNDFKFQYVGAVYRDLETGHNEYVGQGSGWVFIPDDDPLGNRVMPPFAGPGNGGWTTEGGPLLTLKGKDIHIFVLPTGVRPGAILEVGDVFRFAGHIMPTLDSQVTVTVTAPSGTRHAGGGQANPVGYFYDPDDDFAVTEAGLWSVDVRVWHDGQCSGGATIPPYPSGDVLGSEDGRYWFYVVPADSPRLAVSSPSPGFLSFGEVVTPITIRGPVPAGLSATTVDYTISMPGYILQHDQVAVHGDTYEILFDPVTLHEDFPNLDLAGRDDPRPGLADTFSIGLLLSGQSGSDRVYRANTITIQGEQVFVDTLQASRRNPVYLPLLLRGG